MNFVILASTSMKVYRQWLPCKRNSLYNLKMCMWFGFNPAVNFCHFSTLLTLSVLAGATSTSPKFDLFFIILFVFVGNEELDRVITVLLSTAMFVGGVLGFILDNSVPGKL